MNNKMQIFEDLDILVRMCRSKSDGASLVIEEEEIKHKIKDFDTEIEEIKETAEEDIYDTSAEMADRNIEIITKKVIASIKNELKNKNAELDALKEQELEENNTLYQLTANKESHEAYIASMKDRIQSAEDEDIKNRYAALIEDANQKIESIEEELKEITASYKELQEQIANLTASIQTLETKLKSKEEQLTETQTNLENKETYIDQIKLDRNNKKVNDLETKKKTLEERLEVIHNDPKYLEAQIKAILNANEDTFAAREYLTALVEKAVQQPYMNVPADNALEEELLRATQARDLFANEISQKTYNIMEAVTPEQIRTEYLNEKINVWQNELAVYEQKIELIDKDQQYNYQQRTTQISSIIDQMKQEVIEFKKAYEEEPEGNLSVKASLKVAYEEKKNDLEAAEQIASSFRKDEAEDIKAVIEMSVNECEKIRKNIVRAQTEIEEIKNRLLSKKSGLIDISSQNKDKERLKELASVVMDIKHRRQFAESPTSIAQRLEQLLGIHITDGAISNSTVIEEAIPTVVDETEEVANEEELRGVKVTEESPVETQEEPIPVTIEQTEVPVDNVPENDNIIANGVINDNLNNYVNLESTVA